MRFRPTEIAGVFEIEVEPIVDERGSFARVYCAEEFRAHGLELPDRQGAISRNRHRGTLRGLHYIEEHEGEAKLVRCVRGTAFDVAVDLRPGSQSYGALVMVELSAERGNAVHLPRGVAHGFMTLTEDCDILYQFSQSYRPAVEKGVRWDDPRIAVPWPMAPAVLSDRDRNLPLLADGAA